MGMSIQAKEKTPSFLDQFRSLNTVPRFFQMIWVVSPRMSTLNAVLRLVQAALPVAMLYTGKEIIDAIVGLMGQPSNALPSWEHPVWFWLGLECGLAVVNSLLGRAITVVDNLLGDLMSNDSSIRIMKHAATLDLYQFENPAFYDKLERARTSTAGRTMLMSMVLSQIQDLISILFLVGALAAFNPWLIVLLVVAVIPSFMGESHFNRRSYSLTHSWTPERRELDYLRFIGASDQTAKEVKIFGLEDFIVERFRDISGRYFLAHRNLTIRRAAWGSLFSFLGTVSYYAAYAYIVYQSLLGQITIGALTFLAGSFQRMQGLLQGILGRFSRVSEMALYLRDFFDFLSLQPLSGSHSGSLPAPKPIQKGFEFENVSFRYPNTERWAIRNLSFTLHAGEKLALVGENGAGKTTIVKLLAHLYEPTEGRVLLDGIPLCDYNPDELRRAIGVIFQDYFRYALTAAENIAVGNIELRENRAEIVRAAEKSLADEVVDQLPDQYDQMLGKRFDKGVDLSGGQWQKIALARAYMRDAQLVILDEPTASLDARAEHEVFLRFAELIQGKTGILISHRFSTVRMADRILFLEHGQLLELGSHEELLEQGGKYAELFRLQAQGYV
jgi:ATP-binding cassette subfamily B protein